MHLRRWVYSRLLSVWLPWHRLFSFWLLRSGQLSVSLLPGLHHPGLLSFWLLPDLLCVWLLLHGLLSCWQLFFLALLLSASESYLWLSCPAVSQVKLDPHSRLSWGFLLGGRLESQVVD